MIFTIVKGPVTMAVVFNIRTRACLLRAVHTRQQELLSEMERLSQLLDSGAPDETSRENIKTQLTNVRGEVQCLHEAVRQVWVGELDE